jgi:hypothetical protein
MNIAILVPVCSRKQNYTNLSSTPFMKNLYPSFLKYKDDGYKFSFYIGYDSTDAFYCQNIHKLPKLINENLNIIELNDCEHKPAKAWNILFKKAISDNFDYFYQIGDDVIIESPWTNIFVTILEESKNIGVVGACHLQNYLQRKKGGIPAVIENAFVHKTHFHIFGTFFHEKIDNWFCDNWITEIYKPDYSNHLNDLRVKNMIIDNRYEIKMQPEIDKYITEGKEKILRWSNLQ